jgi:hypothetical protein
VRTTVDIPDPTYRRLKTRAAQEGCSVKELILRGVEQELEGSTRPRRRVKLPLVRSEQPGSLDLTSEQIYEIVPFP